MFTLKFSLLVFAFALIFTNVSASSVNDEEFFDALASQRVKRQNGVQIGATHNHQLGTDVNVEAQRRLWTGNNGRSQLDANANFQQHFGGQQGRSRPNYGAGVRFQHRFKRQNSVQIDATHNRHQGTDLTVEAQRRLWTGNNGRSQLDANANFQQHFGGQQGRSRPNYGAGVRFQHRF